MDKIMQGNVSISAFRDTGFPNGERASSKKLINHRNLGESYNEVEKHGSHVRLMPDLRNHASIFLSDDSNSSNYQRSSSSSVASSASVPQHSAGMNNAVRDKKHHSKKIFGQPGGIDHISSGMNASVPEDLNPRRVRTIGGEDHVILGNDNLSYNFGVKEAQYRLAIDPDVQAATAKEPMAGLRPPEHTHRSSGPIGGPVHIKLEDGSNVGPHAYKEGLDEAQRRAAFDPQALAERDALVPAGSRISRNVGIHVSHPTGGVDSVNIVWPESESENSSRAATLRNLRQENHGISTKDTTNTGSNADSPSRILHPIHPVGGRSGAYLGGGTSLSGIFSQDSNINNNANRPSTSSGFRTNQSNSSSSISNIFGNNNNSSGNNVANTPRSPLRREQPLGGRSTLSIGIHGLDNAAVNKSNVLGVSVLPHNRSGLVLG